MGMSCRQNNLRGRPILILKEIQKGKKWKDRDDWRFLCNSCSLNDWFKKNNVKKFCEYCYVTRSHDVIVKQYFCITHSFQWSMSSIQWLTQKITSLLFITSVHNVSTSYLIHYNYTLYQNIRKFIRFV